MTTTRVISTRVPAELEEAVRQRASAKDQTVGEWLRQLLVRSTRANVKGTKAK